jgi:hypothetical protein
VTAAGNWNLIVATPLGERRATLSARTEDGTLKGVQSGEGRSIEIFDGTVTGNELSWKVTITEPLPMTLEFNGTINGDKLIGKVKLGAIGISSFSGVRC